MYRIACRRWPQECPGPIQGIPAKNPEDRFEYKTIAPEIVQIQIANQIIERSIAPEDHETVFEVWLDLGKTFLTTDFIEDGEKYGVYYTYIRAL
jgi:hypothetical protein